MPVMVQGLRAEMSDDRLQICTSFLLEQIKLRRQKNNGHDPFPFFLGLTGAQGIGKTTLVSLDKLAYSISTMADESEEDILDYIKARRIYYFACCPSSYNLPRLEISPLSMLFSRRGLAITSPFSERHDLTI